MALYKIVEFENCMKNPTMEHVVSFPMAQTRRDVSLGNENALTANVIENIMSQTLIATSRR